MSANYWDIIKKKESGEPLSEREELLISSFNEKDVKRDQQLVENSEKYFQQAKFNEDRSWQKLYSEVLLVKKGRKRRIAASILILAILGSASIFTYIRSYSYSNALETLQNLSNNAIVLPDNSEVRVNQHTSFLYPNLFHRKERKVKLSGEAYFTVQSNPDQPFLIETSGFLVKVVGTSFSIRAYPDEQKQTVSVTSGQVVMMDKKLKDEAPGNRIVLYPGEQGVFDQATGKFTKYDSFDSNYLGWLSNEITFENHTLQEVITILDDVFFVKVKCDEQEVLKEKISAQFIENSPEYILKVVSKTYGLNLKKVSEYEYVLTK